MDPNDLNTRFGGNYSNENPNSSTPSPPPVHTPTPIRPTYGFQPYQFSPQAGYAPAYSPMPIFPRLSPQAGVGEVPLNRAMQQFSPYQEADSQPAINLGDDTELTTTEEGGSGRRGRGRGGRRGGRSAATSEASEGEAVHAYSEMETNTLARVWVDISHDSVVSNNQKMEAMWVRIAKRYNSIRPADTLEANDILASAVKQYSTLKNAQFKYTTTWNLVKDTPKFIMATRSNDAVKRCKNSIDGSYSSPSSRESTPSSDWAETYSGVQYRARPEGSRAAKARGKATAGESSGSETGEKRMELAKIADSLENLSNVSIYEIIIKDTTGMTPAQKRAHMDYVRWIRAKMGMPPPAEDDN